MLKFLRRGTPDAKAKLEAAAQKSRRSWFGKVMGMLRSAGVGDEFWDELEEVLVSADVGIDTSLELIESLRDRVRREGLETPEAVFAALEEQLTAMLRATGAPDAPAAGSEAVHQPHVTLVVGVNGVGKTTSIAKLARLYTSEGNRVILAAADTFRAAAIDQLQVWGERLGVDVIAHSQGADPGAVAFDAFHAARARGADALIIDTAGRLHTKSNLMAEARKIRSVVNRLDPSAPHESLLVLDATIGHNGLAQARAFTEAVGCDGVFLAKLDGTARGGIVLAVQKELGLPIRYVGTGEGMEDMAPFDPEGFVQALLAPVD